MAELCNFPKYISAAFKLAHDFTPYTSDMAYGPALCSLHLSDPIKTVFQNRKSCKKKKKKNHSATTKQDLQTVAPILCALGWLSGLVLLVSYLKRQYVHPILVCCEHDSALKTSSMT